MTERRPTTSGQPPAELAAFVLGNAVVHSFPGSRQAWDGRYRLGPRVLDHYDCIYLVRGRMEWTIGEDHDPLECGDLLILPPGVVHAARSTASPMAFLSLHVSLTLPGDHDVFALLGVPRLRHVAPDSRLAAYLAGATAEWDRPAGDPLITELLAAWARLITLELVRSEADRGVLTPQPVDPVVRAGLEVITRSVGLPITPAEIAAEAGVSPQHLNRLFRRTLGVTALQELTQLRMTQAAALLDQSGETVRAIARRLGYDDPYHFSRVFTRHHGVSPIHWRQLHAGTTAPRPAGSAHRAVAALPARQAR